MRWQAMEPNGRGICASEGPDAYTVLVAGWHSKNLKYNTMAKYRAKKITEIEAEQFLPPYGIPHGVFNVYQAPDGIGYSGEVWTIQGQIVHVKPGEWIVREKDNPERFYPIADSVFRDKYELVE